MTSHYVRSADWSVKVIVFASTAYVLVCLECISAVLGNPRTLLVEIEIAFFVQNWIVVVAGGVSIGGNEAGSSGVIVDTLCLDDVGAVGRANTQHTIC